MRMKRHIITLCTAVLSCIALHATEVRRMRQLSGDAIAIGQQITVVDKTEENLDNYSAEVVLTYDENEHHVSNTGDWSIEVTYTIKGLSSHVIATGQKITLDFSGSAPLTEQRKPYLLLPNENEAILEVEHVDIQGDPGIILDNVNLQLHLITTKSGILKEELPILGYNDQELWWSYVAGADHYELEYVYIDQEAYTSSGNQTIAFIGNNSATAFDLKEAVSVETYDQYYPLPSIFPKGKVYFRVRAVSKFPESDTYKKGEWSYGDGVDDFQLSITNDQDQFEVNKNWQVVVSFAEGGKNKYVLTYFDGSLRNRQTVTNINSDASILKKETKYDFEGRPVLDILPVPLLKGDAAENEHLHYTEHLNVFEAQTPQVSTDATTNEIEVEVSSVDAKTLFDKYEGAEELSDLSGTSMYYSPRSPIKSDYDALIPNHGLVANAFGYPYSLSQYLRDGSGRLSKQSGVGKTHRIHASDPLTEAPHYTKYYYGTPTSLELRRLFGSNVGQADKYQKNMVIDPNGQISVTYLDMYGRTVATALAGHNHKGVIDLDEDRESDELTVDILSTKDAVERSSTASQSILVTVAGNYTFHYSLQNNPFHFDPSCKDCSYDLVIEIKDDEGRMPLLDQGSGVYQLSEHGAPIVRTIPSAGNEQVVACNDGNTSEQLDITVYFEEPGTYTVSKRLTAATGNKWAQDTAYFETLTGFPQWQGILDEEMNNIDYSQCDFTCEDKCLRENPDATDTELATCIQNKCNPDEFIDQAVDSHCSALRNELADEFLPDSDAKLLENTSIVNDNSILNLVRKFGFRDENGNLLSTQPSNVNDVTHPTNFQYHWSRDPLVTLHPEYCHYQLCLADKPSKKWDMKFASVETWNVANALGYLDPLSVDPYFNGGNGTGHYKIMSNRLGKYFEENGEQDRNINGNDNYNDVYSLWEYVALPALYEHNSTPSDDEKWLMFKALYNDIKGEIQQDVTEDKSCNYGDVVKDPREEVGVKEDDDYSIDIADINDKINDRYNQECEGTCEENARHWYEMFKVSCTHYQTHLDGLSANNASALENDMKDFLLNYCKENCGRYNPFGLLYRNRICHDPRLIAFEDKLETLGIPCSLKDIMTNSCVTCSEDCDVCDPTCVGVYNPCLCESTKNTHCSCPNNDCGTGYTCDEHTGMCVPLPVCNDNGYCNPKSSCFDCKKCTDNNVNDPCDLTGPCFSCTECKDLSIVKPCVVNSRCFDCTQCGGGFCDGYCDGATGQCEECPTGSVPNDDNTDCECDQTSGYVPDGSGGCSQCGDNMIASDGECVCDEASGYTEVNGECCERCLAGSNCYDADYCCSSTICTIYGDSQAAACTSLETGCDVCQDGDGNCPEGSGEKCNGEVCGEEFTCEEGVCVCKSGIPDGNGGCCTSTDGINCDDDNNPDPDPDPDPDPCANCDPTCQYCSNGECVTHPSCSSDTKYGFNADLYEWLFMEEIQRPALDENTAFKWSSTDNSFTYPTILSSSYFEASSELSYEPSYEPSSESPTPADLEKAHDYFYINSCGCINKAFALLNNYGENPFENCEALGYTGVHIDRNNGTIIIEKSDGNNVVLHLYDENNNFFDALQVDRWIDGYQPSLPTHVTAIRSYVYTGTAITAVLADGTEKTLFVFIPEDETSSNEGLCRPCEYSLPVEIDLVSECEKQLEQFAYAKAVLRWEREVGDFIDRKIAAFNQHCMDNASENFNYTYELQEHHYTLYYYDQAGNLVKTVPPKAVVPIPEPVLADGWQYGEEPDHDYALATDYEYTSMNQLRNQHSPDGGTSLFFYDSKTQLRLSQNAQQKLDGLFSYTKYDALGRIVETGQMGDFPMTQAEVEASPQQVQAYLDNADFPDEGIYPLTQVTKTHYDDVNWWDHNTFKQENLRGRVSTVIRDISKNELNVLYEKVNSLEMSTGLNKSRYIAYGHGVELKPGFHFKADPHKKLHIRFDEGFQTNCNCIETYYSYDEHGNVKSIMQNIADLGEKRTDYEYDLISGNVNKVIYQPGAVDQFIHAYEYDADNRIVSVSTSHDGVIWEEDARYFYYPHGPLERVELGEDLIQGSDYYYTIQGWLKGINTPQDKLSSVNIDYASKERLIYEHFSDQAGKDASSGLNKYVAQDAFALTLNYYEGDYQPIQASTDLGLVNSITTATAPDHAFYNDEYLYNGNITSAIYQVPFMHDLDPTSSDITTGVQANVYQYDQLHRIKQSTSLDLKASTSSWQSYFTFENNSIDNFKTKYSYDANGNITALDRYHADGTWMDELGYSYNDNTNQLNHVTDDKGKYEDDLDTQLADNYQYDAIGNLIQDKANHIDKITWTIDGKVEEVQKDDGSTIHFYYDGMGNRVMKSVAQAGSTADEMEYTYYVRDASGNLMSNYTRKKEENTLTYTQTEVPLYGSSRLGLKKVDTTVSFTEEDVVNNLSLGTLFERRLGAKLYELSDHLGNVRAVISDEKTPNFVGVTPWDKLGTFVNYKPRLVSATHYYPFGAQALSFNSGEYRYGFQGQEKDDEIKGEGNSYSAEYWQYDPRIMRRWNMDPLLKHHESPYATFANNPINFADPNGADTINLNYSKDGVYSITGTKEAEGDDVFNINRGGITQTYTFKDGEYKNRVNALNLESTSEYTLGVYHISGSAEKKGGVGFYVNPGGEASNKVGSNSRLEEGHYLISGSHKTSKWETAQVFSKYQKSVGKRGIKWHPSLTFQAHESTEGCFVVFPSYSMRNCSPRINKGQSQQSAYDFAYLLGANMISTKFKAKRCRLQTKFSKDLKIDLYLKSEWLMNKPPVSAPSRLDF